MKLPLPGSMMGAVGETDAEVEVLVDEETLRSVTEEVDVVVSVLISVVEVDTFGVELELGTELD